MKVVLHEAALRELHEARAWYTARGAAAAGAQLMCLVDEKVTEIGLSPRVLPSRSRPPLGPSRTDPRMTMQLLQGHMATDDSPDPRHTMGEDPR
jgi:hypothetical protein